MMLELELIFNVLLNNVMDTRTDAHTDTGHCPSLGSCRSQKLPDGQQDKGHGLVLLVQREGKGEVIILYLIILEILAFLLSQGRA